MDMDYVGKYFGLFFGIFGGVIILGVFICRYLGVMNYFHRFMPIAILTFCAFIILFFNVIKRKRIYNKSIGQSVTDLQSMATSTKKWRKIIPATIVIVTTVAIPIMLYFSYKDPKIKFSPNSFQLIGVYGVNITFADISKVDTMAWQEMPSISRRTNGFSFSNVNRGYFRTSDGDNIHLSIHRGVSPVIKIVKQNGSVYYHNRKNAEETRLIFNKLKADN
jgi:hypothetical protein